jgi:cystathionine beta-lyase
MDFPAAPPILEALRSLVDHGVFGYTMVGESLPAAYAEWVSARQAAELPIPWMLYVQGVLAGLAVSLHALSETGDGVIIQPPVYHPFAPLIKRNGRIVVENPLVERDGTWSMDLDQLDAVASSSGAAVMLLCSPHNPVSRVWTRNELTELLDVCKRHSLVVISDEIHSDIVMPGNRHTPLYSLAAEAGVETVTLVSPTKTFNLPGVPMAWIIAPNHITRRSLKNDLSAAHASSANVFSVVAAETAYRECGGWFDELLLYIEGNLSVLTKGLAETLPRTRIARLEGTYLAWLDFRPVAAGDVNRKLLESARVRLNDGADFGSGGEGFQRLNLAAPRSLIAEAVSRIGNALS